MALWCPLEKDDAQCAATLEAVLAFIDAYNEEFLADEPDCPTSSLAPGPETLELHSQVCGPDPSSSVVPSKHRVSLCGNHDGKVRDKGINSCNTSNQTSSGGRKRPDAGNTMRVRNYRRRNRAEIQELRSKVARMEAQLAQLQSRVDFQQQRKQQYGGAWLSSCFGSLTAKTEFQMQQTTCSGVNSERKKRLQSESTNQQLKQIFFALTEMGTSMDKFLRMSVTASDLNALFGIETLRIQTFVQTRPSTANTNLMDLHQDLDQIYLSAKVKHMMDPVIKQACSSSQVHTDSQRGPVYEFSASTPLKCHFQVLDKHVNSHMDRLRDTTNLTTTQTKSGRKTVVQTQFTTVVSSARHGQFYLDGISVLGKYDECDRSVIACSSRFALPGTGLVFHEKGYLAAVNGVQAEDSSPRSLCQIDYHIFAASETEEDPTQLRDYFLINQWRRMQAHQLEVQNVLLHELACLHATPQEHNREAMSKTPAFLLVDDDENAATLEEALAFIDAYDDDHVDAVELEQVSSTDGDPTSPLSDAFHQGDQTDASRSDSYQRRDGVDTTVVPAPKRRARRIKNREVNTNCVRRYRKRNKEELEELRLQVTRMNSQLQDLRCKRELSAKCAQQKQNDLSVVVKFATMSTTDPLFLQMYMNLIGLDRAVWEIKLRQESESMNRYLKETLAELVQMSKTQGGALFHKKVTSQDMNALFGIQAMQFQTIVRSSLTGRGGELRILNDLRLSIDQIYLGMKVPDMEIPQAEFDYSEFRDDPVWGRVYEIKALLLLNCSYSQLNCHVCNHIMPYTNQQGEWFTQFESGKLLTGWHFSLLVQVPSVRKFSFEKQFVMTFHSPQFGKIYLDGISVFAKFDELDHTRSVLVRSSRFVLRGTDLAVNERTQIVMAGTHSASSVIPELPSSQLEFNYQLFASSNPSIPPNGSLALIRDFILKTQSQRVRAHHLEVQNVLRHELDALTKEGKPRSPFLVECPIYSTYAQ
ncbi:hypothetical protein FI667_g11720, partial [Globisporangium splendens]